VRQVPADCSQLPTLAQDDAGRAVSALLAEATRAAARGQCVSSLTYHINLAIDYLDFAPPARRRP
jgi:hypothetical protein